MRDLPRGTVTLLFTDIEGSTRLIHELGDGYAPLLAEHRRALRDAFQGHGGVEVDTQGDAFFYVFARAQDAVAAASQGQHSLDGGRIRVRMGIHTGEPQLTEEGYVGVDVHRAARVMAAGHGGQVLVSASTAQLVNDPTLRDVGEHRLKDMTAPQRLYQLGDGAFPPLRTLDSTNLPVAASALIGREPEVEAVVGMFGSETRLVTITGPGGIGKTRLALQVASELVGRFHDGVFWVPLAQLTDPDLVMSEIGRVLGQTDVIGHLQNRETLLLLDNLEQLLDVAPRLAQVLALAPRCTLLVTSRAPVRIAGEYEYPLQPLSTDAAVALFVDRARAAGSRLVPSDAITSICRQLDSLPLAIELAAARTKLMDPVALRARLDQRLPLLTGGPRDAPERQRTLRATIEWSHDLLADAGRRLFMHVSVFVGGFTLDAAEAVCDADLDTLGSLVDMSLLRAIEGGRFQMLETLREFANGRLTDAGEWPHSALRHATWYADQAERLEADRRVPGKGAAAAAELDAERGNIRAAAVWAGDAGQRSLQLRLLTAARDSFLRGPHSWLRAQLDAALATELESPSLRAHGLATLSFTAYRQGDHRRAESAARESLELAQRENDLAGIATAFNYLANVDNARGRYSAARSHLARALEASRAGGDSTGVAIGLANLSDIALSAGDFDLGQRLALEAYEASGPDGDPHLRQIALINAATGAVRSGRLDEAESAVLEAIAFGRRSDDPLTIATGLRILAVVAIGRHDLLRAARLAGQGAVHDAVLETTLEPTEQALDDVLRSELAGLDPKVLAAELEVGRTGSLDDALSS